jgi:hypothetical protein
MKILKVKNIKSNIFIQFQSLTKASTCSFFTINHKEMSYFFQGCEIETNSENILVTAKEVGYWFNKLDHDEYNLDIRDLLNLPVTEIIDQDLIETIKKKSNLC